MANRCFGEAAKEVGIDLKQTFAKEGKDLSRKAGRYAHARQFKRMRRAIKRQRTVVGWLRHEIGHNDADGQAKLYAWLAPEVDSISKGKVKQTMSSA